MSETPQPTAYRPCVGIMVFNAEGHVWVGRRVAMPGDSEGQGTWWQMPQGGIDAGEDPLEETLRELEEETGLTGVTMLGQTADWLTYDLPDHLVGVAWKGTYRGQKQMWFAVRYSGPDDAVVIDPPPGSAHEKEFDAWRWMSIDELEAAVVPFKRDVYRQAIAELRRYADPLI